MHHDYADIRDRIAEPPTWWDEHGVPRWGEFGPDALPNIYARECCLLLIECQGCGCRFRVALSAADIDWGANPPKYDPGRLERAARAGELGYGDPPNVWCCPAGPTMTSIPIGVLEFWRKERAEWGRVPEAECPQDPDWIDD